MRVAAAEFRTLPLQVHDFLASVPLADVSAVDLPGGGPGRTLAEVRALVRADALVRANTATRLLFALRFWVGRVFGWDRRQGALSPESYIHRLTAAQRDESLIPPGTAEGAFRIVYARSDEVLTEIRNATVHGFLCAALVPAGAGYRLYWAVFVRPVSRWTRPYMLAIEPFRRFIVYPSILGRVRRAWIAKYGARTAPMGYRRSRRCDGRAAGRARWRRARNAPASAECPTAGTSAGRGSRPRGA